MNKKRFMRSAIASTAAAAVVGLGMYVPAQAATRSTVIVIESNTMTALLCNTPETNLVINCDISYLTQSGFQYYNDKKKLTKNTIFGSFKIVKNTKNDFRVQYTVAPGRVWSDGTPINGIDLMLQHVITSTAFAKKAGLPDPSDPDVVPAFNSGAYDGVYDNHVVGLPVLSADKMSITVSYDGQIPDWELQGPGGPYQVHVLEHLAAGKTALGTAAENAAAKEKFYTDVTTYNKAALEKMGTAYNEAWNILSVDKATNPLLLVGNGAYTVESAVKDQRVTMVLNPKYNSGPATSGITTIVLNSNVADGSPAAQALANKDIDIYQGQPTADAVAQLRAIKSAKLNIQGSVAYEHIELRLGSSDGTPYKGPFSDEGDKQKAQDLRTAFLLAYPRQEIVDKLMKAIDPSAVVIGSTITFPLDEGYAGVIAGNGSGKYLAGNQKTRTAAALKLVRKYYPTASATNQPVKINLLWGSPGNARRAFEAAMVIAEEKKAGFAVTAPATAGWGGKLESSAYDAHFFIFESTAALQDGQACGTYKSTGGSNYIGYKNSQVDAICEKLQAKQLSPSEARRLRMKMEGFVNADAAVLGIFQNPNVTAWDGELTGIKPAPFSPTLFWNFWEWHY